MRPLFERPEPTQHTPKPWDFGIDNDTGPNDDYFHEWYTAGPAQIHFRRGEEAQARLDAKLIVAAPDLLEALKAWKEYELTYSSTLSWDELQAMVDAAIAKAEEV